MSEEKFDVIVIGGGLAGLSAAYRLAKAEKEVLVIEKGPHCGSKNVSGGRLYTYALDALMGDEWKGKAPLEREITREMLMLMTDDEAMTIDTSVHAQHGQSYSVLRNHFDRWLADQCEELGAMVIGDSTVTDLIRRDGKVCGVVVGEEELEADLIIDAEGVNPLVAERSGVIAPIKLENIAVAAKYVIRLDEKVIRDRFGLEGDEGAAMLGMGSANKGIFGGLFLYTNKDSISIGLVQDSKTWKDHGEHLPTAIEDLKEHPVIGKYLDGGEVVEYTAHLIPEGGFDSFSEFCGDGILVAGDAAGLCMNRGFTVRGMDYAIMSGIAAAETAISALEEGIFTKDFLKSYESRLQKTVLEDFKTLRKGHGYMAGSNKLFTTYPKMAIDVMHSLYNVDGAPAEPVMTLLRRNLKGLNLTGIAKDLLKGVRSL
ncbi:FAD-dependent oxidoreductase [Peptococcus simiae]|uniref:FAD-dependent oxidoreductase n=1 Tax=Peptococcus simiae TaxID=1643805 RepID=UPI00397F0D12